MRLTFGTRLIDLSPYRGAGGAGAAFITITNLDIPEDAAIGTTIGVFSVVGGTGTYTFTLLSDPDNKLDVSGTNGVNLITTAALNFETDTTHPFVVQADNGVDTPLTRALDVNVTDVSEFEARITEDGVDLRITEDAVDLRVLEA